MAHPGIPKLSLIAQYDDLCRYSKTLTAGCEEEFKIFAKNQLACRRKLKESESDVQSLKDKIASLDAEKRKLETQMKHLKNLCESEVIKRKQAEKENASMERQLALIKDVLLADSNNLDHQTKEKLAFLSSAPSLRYLDYYDTDSSDNAFHPLFHNVAGVDYRLKISLATIEESVGSALSLSDYDITDEDLDEDSRKSTRRRVRRSKGKRSSSESRVSPKRKKSDPEQPSAEIQSYNKQNVLPKKAGIRSNSEPAGNAPNTPITLHVHRSDSDQFKFNTPDFRRRNTAGTPVGRYSTGGKLSRNHVFATKTVIRPEKCYPCGRNIGFCKQALKCQNCRIACHAECEDRCPVPCVPTGNTPTKGAVGTIGDYVPATAPKIPALVIHCINEIEMRGLREIGLYRISGTEREVKELKEKFLRGCTVPCLNRMDIHAICGTVKEFLRSLAEPLIPRSVWQTFVEAAEISNEAVSVNALHQGLMDLPPANKDTLAFIILHLQRVAESKDCKMPIENLAKVFGPTILGYSSSEPTDINMLSETKYQHKVMQRLLKISSDSLEKLLNVEPDVFQNTAVKTPETLPAPVGTRLGPIYSGHKARGMSLTRTPLTPRNTKFSKSERNHFSSPLLRK